MLRDSTTCPAGNPNHGNPFLKLPGHGAGMLEERWCGFDYFLAVKIEGIQGQKLEHCITERTKAGCSSFLRLKPGEVEILLLAPKRAAVRAKQ